jgi:hypothetical protein
MMGSAKEMVCRALTSIHLLRPTHACAGRRRRWVEFDAERGQTAARPGEILFMMLSFNPPLTTFLQSEAEKTTAQTKAAGEGLYDQMAGKANAMMGAVMGDSGKEASGEFVLPCPFLYTSPLLPFYPPRLYPRVSCIPCVCPSFSR